MRIVELLTTVFSLAGQLGLTDLFFQIYGRYIWTAGLILALLNCFFGYRLRKLWSVLAGFLLGAAAGIILCLFSLQPVQVTLAAALISGAVCAVLAFLFYRAGLLLLTAGLTAFALWHFLPLHSNILLAVCLAAGLAAGIFALKKERPVVSLATAIGGGWIGAQCLFLLTGAAGGFLLFLTAAGLSVLGILFQLKPWKGRRYWQEKDKKIRLKEKDRRKHRARRQKKKEKKARKNEKRKKRASSPEPKRAPSRRTGSALSPEPDRELSRQPDHMLSPQPDWEPDRQPDHTLSPQPDRKPSRQNGSSLSPEPDWEPSRQNGSSLSPQPDWEPDRQPDHTLSPEPGRTAEPDLSDVRRQLARDISSIYQESHPEEGSKD
jgi:hypothetical protein